MIWAGSAGLAVSALVLSVLPAAALPADAARGRFIAGRHCVIRSLLASTREREPSTTARDRFVTLSVAGEPQQYVQCIFRDDDRRMLCEASSGAFRYRHDQGMRLDMSRDAAIALDRLGFTLPDPTANYVQVVELGSPPNLDRVATLMLATLYDAYRAEPSGILDFKAPKGTVDLADCGQSITKAMRRR